jgi:hypothetical protein
MKTKLYLLMTAVALLFLLPACENILDLNPRDQPSQATFWKTEADYDNALTACYARLQHEYFSTGLPYWDNLSDNGYGQHNYGSSTDIAQGNITTNTGGLVSGIYNESYSAIARINIYLDNLKGFNEMNADKKKYSEAEARMLRAFFYSYLYRCYGEVPIVSEPLNLSNQYQPKKPAAEVLSFLMQDLDFAIANLPSKTYSEYKGRWTSDAAKAYKARMLLYDAYDGSGNAVAAQMNEVRTLLNDISGYRLANDYSDNFIDGYQETSPEIMYSVKFLAPNNRHSADLWYGDWVVVSPLVNLISMYDMADGRPGEPIPYTGRGVITATEFTNASLLEREPRAAKTFFITRYVINGVEYGASNATPLGSGLGKFLSVDLKPPFSRDTQSQQAWVIIRYADVLLMLAEAENEVNGPTSAVYSAINAIRQRSGAKLLPDGLTQDQMRERIRHERRIELAFEGQRYFDLKRWKIAKQVLNNVQDGLIVYKFEDHHYLWPLPKPEIDKANGILVQNPNY